MTVRLSGRYLGNKKVELRHDESGALLVTDAPKDNNGEGTSFSPTDLFAASLGSCMLTVIGIMAERKSIEVGGMYFELEKHMVSDPRRIGALSVTLHLPSGLSEEARRSIEVVARGCPVSNSLDPRIEVTFTFLYDV